MWKIKYFKNYNEAKKFMLRITKNAYKYELIFVHNGYAVEYKKIKTIKKEYEEFIMGDFNANGDLV
jgi:hypothetical protein